MHFSLSSMTVLVTSSVITFAAERDPKTARPEAAIKAPGLRPAPDRGAGRYGASMEWWVGAATDFPSGELGVVTGHYPDKSKDQDSKPVGGRGNYLPMCRGCDHPKWQATVDIGS